MNAAQISHRVLLAFTLLLVAACGSDSPTDTGPRVASITVATAARGSIVSNLVAIGDTVRLVATVKDEAGNILTGRGVTWNSDSPALATVSGSGLVTGLARNLADSLRPITVTASSERVSGSAPIIVVGTYPVGVFMLPTRANLVTSGSQDFTATVGFDFTNLGVTWSIEGCAGGPAVCGSLTNVTTASATYVAPALVPPSTPWVTASAVRYAGKSSAVSVPIAASSTDGQIAFQSHRDNSDDIYLISPGGSVSRLTSMARAYFPAWSPDGAKLAFAGKFSDEFFRVASIYVMNADGSNLTRLATERTDDAFPAWSPDGTKIAFTSNRDGNSEIYVMNADGSGQVNLTHNSAADSDPTWSPDGAKIAFTSDRDGDAEIYVMNADGSGVRNLTNYPAEDGEPAWSPDGTRIAFVSVRDGNWEIYVMKADGTEVTRLTNDAGQAGHPAWSPDGAKLAFSKTSRASEEDSAYEIYVMNADGSGVKGITTDGWEPSWRPQPQHGSPSRLP